MRISDWSSDVCSSDLLLEADLRMRVEVAPPGGDLLLQGGDAVVVAAGKDRGGRDGGGHLGFPPRRAALPPVSHAEPVSVIPASTPPCIHARDDPSKTRRTEESCGGNAGGNQCRYQ